MARALQRPPEPLNAAQTFLRQFPRVYKPQSQEPDAKASPRKRKVRELAGDSATERLTKRHKPSSSIQKSRLLSLPGELRDTIYGHVIGTDVQLLHASRVAELRESATYLEQLDKMRDEALQPYEDPSVPRAEGARNYYLRRYELHKRVPQRNVDLLAKLMNLSILQVSHQMLQEVMAYIYRSVNIHIKVQMGCGMTSREEELVRHAKHIYIKYKNEPCMPLKHRFPWATQLRHALRSRTDVQTFCFHGEAETIGPINIHVLTSIPFSSHIKSTLKALPIVRTHKKPRITWEGEARLEHTPAVEMWLKDYRHLIARLESGSNS